MSQLLDSDVPWLFVHIAFMPLPATSHLDHVWNTEEINIENMYLQLRGIHD